jgi:hypothetical protein
MVSRVRQSLVFWMVLGYGALLAAHVAATVFPGAEAFRERRGFALQHVLRVSRPLLQAGHGKELVRYLHDAQSTGLVDYFEVAETRGHGESAGRVPPSRPVLTDAVSETSDGWVWGRGESADTTLRIASGTGWRTRLETALDSELARLPFDAFFLLFACALGFFYQGRARRQAAQGVVEISSRREARRAKTPRAEAPARAKAPETGDFAGVCGRTSILNHAELAADPANFFAALEDFYADCSAIVGRYRGKLHGVHGHELLFYFSEKDSRLDACLALAAARDFEEIAARRGFRLGTGLAQGRLHGGYLVAGFALFGAPVEESAELVLAAAGAKESIVLVDDHLAATANGFASFRAPPAGSRRQHARALVSTEAVGAAIERARGSGSFEALALHRGDAALASILTSLAVEGKNWERDHYVGAVSELRRVTCRRCGPAVVDAYRALLTAELARKDTYRLSSVVALASTLLHRAVIDRALERLFLQAVAVKDRRVRANAVELFTKFFPEREIPELRSLIRDEDNRVSANALVKAACERFDERVIAKIEERVRGGSVAHVASALHAMGEIALYYRKHDPLFLGTKLSFLRLFDGVPANLGHPNTMIRRQALVAAHKLQSEALDARLRELFATCQDPELLGLFATVYGWRKEAVRIAA